VPFVYPGEVCGPTLLGSAEEMVPLRKWEESKEQIMSKHIFALKEGYCFDYPSNIFRNTRGFEI